MTTITLDPQPDGPKCFSTDALTAPRSVAPSQSPLVCEWKRTADRRGMRALRGCRSYPRRTAHARARSKTDCNCQSGRLTGVDLAASAAGSDRPLDGRRRYFSRPCDGRLIPFHHGKFAPNKSGVRPWKAGHPVAPRARAAMRRHGGPAKRAGRHGIMCPSPHHGGTDRGCTLLPSADLAPVQKRLRPFSAQFHDFRPVRAQIATA
jgi:hypothetical protein